MKFKFLGFSNLVALTVIASTSAVLALAGLPSSSPKLSHKYPLTIDGTATLYGKWSCGGDAKVEVEPAQRATRVPGLNVGLQTVTVSTYAPAIDCGDSNMNKNLRKALKTNHFPEIQYRALTYELVDNGSAVQTSGEMTIAGVTKPVALGAKLVALPEGGTKVTGKLTIDMTDYGVKPPSVLFGALKVANVVTVSFDTVVELPREVTQSIFRAGK